MKQVLFAVLILGVSATGCSKKSDPAGGGSAAATATDDATPCAASIGKAISAMTNSVKGRMGGEMAGALTERMDKLKTALVTHCTADKWPDAVVKCFDTASRRTEMLKCQEALTSDQKLALEADVGQAMTRPMGRHGGSDDDMRRAHGGMMNLAPTGVTPGSGSATAGSGSGSATAGSAAAKPATP